MPFAIAVPNVNQPVESTSVKELNKNGSLRSRIIE